MKIYVIINESKQSISVVLSNSKKIVIFKFQVKYNKL